MSHTANSSGNEGRHCIPSTRLAAGFPPPDESGCSSHLIKVGHRDMLHRRPIILLAGLVLLGCVWLLIPSKSPRPPDLSVTFLALTNDPGRSAYPRLSVISDGRGLHALFSVSNVSRVHFIQFGVDGLEKQVGSRWSEHVSDDFKSALGMTWTPGFSSVYAIPWPQGLDTATPWRLRLWVKRERRGLFALVNQRVGRELFHPWGHQTTTSSIVRPKGSGVLGADGQSAQDGAANGNQPIRSETNSTSAAAGSRR
jgi:hypothetical protein